MTPTDPTAPAGGAADHARVWALLPWLVNGSASAVQRADAQAHLAGCADCRAELQWQTELQAAFQQAPLPLPDAEAGLQKLLGRLDSNAEAGSGSTDPAPVSAGRPAGGHATRWLAAAVVVQAVALGTLGLAGLAGGRSGDAAPYRALSQAPATPDQATLRVLPDAQLPLGQWQLLLQQQGLQVVEGPNTAGAYGLAPVAGAAAGGAAVAASGPGDTLARLRAHPGIRMAEPVVR